MNERFKEDVKVNLWLNINKQFVRPGLFSFRIILKRYFFIFTLLLWYGMVGTSGVPF